MKRLHGLIGCASIVALTVVASRSIETIRPRSLTRPLGNIPADIAGWTGSDDPELDPRVVSQLNATDYLWRTYRRQGTSAGLFVAYYGRQRLGADIHPPKDCLPGNGWNVDSTGEVNVSPTRPVALYYIQKGDERRIVLYWYQDSERVMATELAAKVHLLRAAFRSADTSGLVARIILEDKPDAIEIGGRFASAVMDTLQIYLPH